MFRRRTAGMTLGTALTVALVASGAGVAQGHSDEVLELGLLAAEAVPADVADPGQALPFTAAPNGSIVESNETQVLVPSDPSDDLVVSLAGHDLTVGLTIGLPENAVGESTLWTEGSTTVYEGTEASTVVNAFEEGIRLTSVINQASDTESYDYTLPKGVNPIIEGDGSVTLQSEFTGGDPLEGEKFAFKYGTVDPAWAVDANGAPVETSYEVADGHYDRS